VLPRVGNRGCRAARAYWWHRKAIVQKLTTRSNGTGKVPGVSHQKIRTKDPFRGPKKDAVGNSVSVNTNDPNFGSVSKVLNIWIGAPLEAKSIWAFSEQKF